MPPGSVRRRRSLTGAARPRRYLGQINPTDFFTRLLAGIAYTRLAPASFYKNPSGPDRHFDGMCVAPRPHVCRPSCLRAACSKGVRCPPVLVVVYRRDCQFCAMCQWKRMRVGMVHPVGRGRTMTCCGRRPIDFVAAGISGVLSNHRSGIDCYHVVNPHWDDGVSLDAIVGWVSEARGGVRHIQDYAQWCAPGPPRGVISPCSVRCSSALALELLQRVLGATPLLFVCADGGHAYARASCAPSCSCKSANLHVRGGVYREPQVPGVQGGAGGPGQQAPGPLAAADHLPVAGAHRRRGHQVRPLPLRGERSCVRRGECAALV